ncbi:hypothetical protein CRG98_036643 [Punica granatum]|uniref:Mitochondrial acidic protein MAM33 n=1 Tax=Punica granatum TaxID=22663 RepID=A0A2I0IFR1_PUNGR|nr:hypothetical protein CRG98_036643 [Punica granatum]
MPKATAILRQCRRAIEDQQLLKVLKSEIAYELSSDRFKDHAINPPVGFVMEWDAPQSQDVLLRRKCETGEEIAVSAMLGPVILETECVFPREVSMKVSLKNPDLPSVLQFDCGVFAKSVEGSEIDIRSAYFLQSPTAWGPSIYKGPPLETLDLFQSKLLEFLVAKGVGSDLTDFLLFYLHKKEQDQYVKWLQKLESIIACQ